MGHQPVYDIEVEGTHNFIANGIVAHNTTLSPAAAGAAPGQPVEGSGAPATAMSEEGRRALLQRMIDPLRHGLASGQVRDPARLQEAITELEALKGNQPPAGAAPARKEASPDGESALPNDARADLRDRSGRAEHTGPRAITSSISGADRRAIQAIIAKLHTEQRDSLQTILQEIRRAHIRSRSIDPMQVLFHATPFDNLHKIMERNQLVPGLDLEAEGEGYVAGNYVRDYQGIDESVMHLTEQELADEVDLDIVKGEIDSGRYHRGEGDVAFRVGDLHLQHTWKETPAVIVVPTRTVFPGGMFEDTREGDDVHTTDQVTLRQAVIFVPARQRAALRGAIQERLRAKHMDWNPATVDTYADWLLGRTVVLEDEFDLSTLPDLLIRTPQGRALLAYYCSLPSPALPPSSLQPHAEESAATEPAAGAAPGQPAGSPHEMAPTPTELPARVAQYARMTADTLQAMIARRLGRPLTDDETRQGAELVRRLSAARAVVLVTERLNAMLEHGGRPNVCLLMDQQAQRILDDLSIPSVEVTKYHFMLTLQGPSTLYPMDQHVYFMWSDTDERDEPIHQFFVARLFGVPVVLELSGDQFVKAPGALGPFADAGIMVIPVEELQEHDWPYVGGYAYLSPENRERLAELLNHDARVVERIVGPPAAGAAMGADLPTIVFGNPPDAGVRARLADHLTELDRTFGVWSDQTARSRMQAVIHRVEALVSRLLPDADGTTVFTNVLLYHKDGLDWFNRLWDIAEPNQLARALTDREELMTVGRTSTTPEELTQALARTNRNVWNAAARAALDEAYGVTQWDLLHRFPGAGGFMLWRGVMAAHPDQGAAYIGLPPGTVVTVQDEFFSHMPGYVRKTFTDAEMEWPLILMFVPMESIRMTSWLRHVSTPGSLPYEPEMVVRGPATFRDVFYLDSEEDLQRLDGVQRAYEDAIAPILWDANDAAFLTHQNWSASGQPPSAPATKEIDGAGRSDDETKDEP